MGAAWCRERARAVQDSKSALDRILVRCVSQVYPPEDRRNGSAGKDTHVNDSPGLGSSRASPEWEEVTLHVPEMGRNLTPVPPPRKKRQLRRKMGVTRPPAAAPHTSRDDGQSPEGGKVRPKNVSSISLPNYSELAPKAAPDGNFLTAPTPERAGSVSSVSEATVERVETYMRRCRSFGSMPEQLADMLSNLRSSDSEDSWAGLDDWDLGVHEVIPHHGGSPPVSPRSKLHSRGDRNSTSSPDAVPCPGSPSEVEEWFGREGYTAGAGEGELQSIMDDLSRPQQISIASTGAADDSAKKQKKKKKKISVASVTPPPSPELGRPPDKPAVDTHAACSLDSGLEDLEAAAKGEGKARTCADIAEEGGGHGHGHGHGLRLDASVCSSGRSSMTPSLSELEAALSDMLEKSAEEEGRGSPAPPTGTVIQSRLPC